MSQKIIYLIRNAEAYSNIDTEKKFGQNVNSHLTIFGKENAILLSNYLSKELNSEIGNIHYFYDSTRSKETAEIILSQNKNSKLVKNDLLSVFNWGDLTNQPYEDFLNEDLNIASSNIINPYQIIIPNGDSIYDAIGRINKFLQNFWISEEKIISVISDSLVLNIFSLIATQSSLSKIMMFEIANCGLSKIIMKDINNYRIEYWNDNHFLKKRQRKLYNVFNLHFIDYCNFRCQWCYVEKEQRELSIDQLKKIIDQISYYFKYYQINDGRINIAGGEPLISSKINDLIDYIFQKNIDISIITNGYFLSKEFIERNKNKIKMIGISVDSLIKKTNLRIGRCQTNGCLLEKQKLIDICKVIKQNNIKLKINTVLTKLNLNEDFNEFYNEVKPDRVKILQMLCDDNDKKNVEIRTTKEEMEQFIQRHNRYVSIGESADSMINSYLIVNSEGILDTNNWHKGDKSNSLLTGDIIEIMDKLEIDAEDFEKRYENK